MAVLSLLCPQSCISLLCPQSCINERQWPDGCAFPVVPTEMQKMRKERDALQKQVQLINGQLSLMEGSKKRSDDTAQRMQDELAQLRSKLETSRKEWVIVSACPEFPVLFFLFSSDMTYYLSTARESIFICIVFHFLDWRAVLHWKGWGWGVTFIKKSSEWSLRIRQCAEVGTGKSRDQCLYSKWWCCTLCVRPVYSGQMMMLYTLFNIRPCLPKEWKILPGADRIVCYLWLIDFAWLSAFCMSWMHGLCDFAWKCKLILASADFAWVTCWLCMGDLLIVHGWPVDCAWLTCWLLMWARCAEAKRVAAQVTSLSEQLQKAKDKQESQEKLIRTMKEVRIPARVRAVWLSQPRHWLPSHWGQGGLAPPAQHWLAAHRGQGSLAQPAQALTTCPLGSGRSGLASPGIDCQPIGVRAVWFSQPRHWLAMQSSWQRPERVASSPCLELESGLCCL